MTIKQFMYSPSMLVAGKVQLPLAIAIYLYFAWSNAPTQAQINYPDWLMHFVGNSALYASFWMALLQKKISNYLFIALVPFSVAVEFGQHFNPQRQVDSLDIVANVSGLIVGLLLCKFFEKKYLDTNL